jgi:hypothetical protein
VDLREMLAGDEPIEFIAEFLSRPVVEVQAKAVQEV